VKHPVARTLRILLLAPLLCADASLHAQTGQPTLGRSINWRSAQAPFNPSNGAIVGGPGSDPNPGTPMYICRAQIQNSVIPGKWVQGNCNIAYNGAEQIMRDYQVAYGSATWGPYHGGFYGLAQTGNDSGGNPLYSCRVHYSSGTDYGYQPGKLGSDGLCRIPFGGTELPENPPFEVLYATGGGRPPYIPYPYPYPYPQPQPASQPYPACKLGDPGVSLDINTGYWVGPNCSSIDSGGRITQLKYPSNQPPAPPAYQPPPPPYEPGPSSVTWQPAQSPFTPGDNAIKGGPGNAPKPDSPLYVCRVDTGSALFPGKWIQGECNYSDNNGKELVSKTYEVANGPAEWRNFDGDIGALVPGGYNTDGTHLYICRKQISSWGSNKGYQPGYLQDGVCHIPYNVDTVEKPPFEALYNVFNAPAPQPTQPAQETTQSNAPTQGAQPHGILISVTAGTTDTAGTVTVTNGSSGTTVSKPLPPNSSPQQCVQIIQQAAFEAGLQIQGQPGGTGLRVYGINNAVNVTQASISITQF
jgi:hypothetical protein